MNEEELLKRLHEAFETEARERVKAISSGIVNLEKLSNAEEQQPIIEDIYREFHSLKGAARAVNLDSIEILCQSVESVLAKIKSGDISPDLPFFDMVYSALDRLEMLLSEGDASGTGIEDLLKQIEKVKNGERVQASPSPKAEKPIKEKGPVSNENALLHGQTPSPDKTSPPGLHRSFSFDSVRISTQKLDTVLLKAEEFVSVKLISMQHLKVIRCLLQDLQAWEKQWTQVEESTPRCLRKQGSDDRSLPDLLAFVNWNQEKLKAVKEHVRSIVRSIQEDYHSCSLLVDDFLDDIKEISMQPCATLLNIFPRMIRGLSRDLGKEIDFIVEGDELEIDRRILEDMKDPLIHLLRNAVDHGIETPEERRKAGKSTNGTIKLIVSRSENQKVEVLVQDDGKGIDATTVKENALKNGLILEKDAEELDAQQVLSLIFRTGLSTSPIVTKLSGRGLGMDIVQKKIEELGGIISVDSIPGKGTTFRISLPVSMSTFRGILVRISGRSFVLPSSHVEYVMTVNDGDIKTVGNRPSISVHGRVIAVIDLARTLSLPAEDKKSSDRNRVMVVLGHGNGHIAIEVEEVLKEQEVLVKGLGKQLVRVPYLSGATILGTGELVPVLNVADLFKSSSRETVVSPARAGEIQKTTRKSILVAEDSITSRMLLKNILETAGYVVKTAVDGREAYMALKTESFDLVVSDIEMPRMDGFELTSKIRSDEGLKEIPVVLVTGLDSKEDKEHGIDVGANAYIVKSRFDQDSLLSVIRRFI